MTLSFVAEKCVEKRRAGPRQRDDSRRRGIVMVNVEWTVCVRERVMGAGRVGISIGHCRGPNGLLPVPMDCCRSSSQEDTKRSILEMSYLNSVSYLKPVSYLHSHAMAFALLRGRSTSQLLSATPRRFDCLIVQQQPRRIASASARTYSSTSSIKKKGFVEWYESHLQSRPITTKACTGAFLWGIGDIVAQVMPVVLRDETVSKQEFNYDGARTARAVTFGFAIHAPLSHLHFNFLEWMAVRGGFQGLSVTVFKTVMEQFVYWSWFSNSLYHGAMGAMQGMDLDQIYNRIADVLMDTQIAQWKFWIPVQLINFRFTPVQHQLNVVLLTSVVWTALLSAWYPPEPTTKGLSK